MIKRLTGPHGLAGVAILALLCPPTAWAQGQTNNHPTPAGPRPAPVSAPAAVQPPAPVGIATQAGDVARSTFIQSMDAEFRKRDLNGDGKVTRAEVEQFERNATLAKAQAENRALFAALDTDRNGLVSPSEFAALVKNSPLPDVSAQMQRFDTNRDQIISLVEYRTATLINFDRLDADKDGVVTERELAAANTSPAPANPISGR